MENFDVHNIDRKLEVVMKRIKTEHVSKQNQEIILKFHDFGFSTGLSKKRIIKYMYSLIKIAQWLNVPLENASKDEIMGLVGKIEQKNLSEWTKHDYKVVIKRFYKWLDGDDDYPERVKWIKTTHRKNKKKIPDELLTMDEIEKMIEAADNLRDKALISLISESGVRIEELLTLQIKHITFDEFGAIMRVNEGKTGMRRVRLVASVPYLANWIENHHFKGNLDAPLWIKIGAINQDEIVHYENARRIIKTLAKKAGINKRVHPHLFRHSRATDLAEHFTDSQLDEYFGWVPGSFMPSTYVHLSGKHLDRAILELNGIKVEKNQKREEPRIKKCHRCKEINPSKGKFCYCCGAPLEMDVVLKIEEKRKKMDDLMSLLFKNPRVQKVVLEEARQIKANQLCSF